MQKVYVNSLRSTFWRMRNNSLSKQSSILLLLCLFFVLPCAIAQSVPVKKESLVFGGEIFRIAEVPDPELALLVGKATGIAPIVGMQLDLVSSWQTQNDTILEGGVSLRFDFSSAQAKVQSSASARVVNGQSAGGQSSAGQSAVGQINGSLPLATVRGVGQAIQIAGDANSVNNKLNIDVVNAVNSSALSQGVSTDLSKSARGSGGETVVASIGQNGVNVTLNVPGSGSARQSLASIRDPGLRQLVQVNSSANTIANQARLTLTVNPSAPRALTDVLRGSLSTVTGLQR